MRYPVGEAVMFAQSLCERSSWHSENLVIGMLMPEAEVIRDLWLKHAMRGHLKPPNHAGMVFA